MLKTNLQFFGDDDFDLESFQAEFESNWTDEPIEELEETEDIVYEEVENPVEEPEVPNEVEPSETEPQEETPQFQTQKQNEAFANMRKQMQEAKKYQDFLARIAEESGTSPEDLMKQYEERQLEQQAEQRGVPVDILKRLNALETENKTVKEQAFAEKFNMQVESTKEKYKLNDEDLGKVFDYMAQNGLDPQQVPIRFEDAYFLANRDNILKQTEEKAKQSYLAEKKKRQNSSAPPIGTSDSPNNPDSVSDEEVLQALKDLGAI